MNGYPDSNSPKGWYELTRTDGWKTVARWDGSGFHHDYKPRMRVREDEYLPEMSSNFTACRFLGECSK